VKNMRRRLVDMGLSPNKPSVVETLVRTHAQMSFNAAQYRLEQDDPEGLITGYQYVTVGDDRVRDEHAEMDGHVFKIGDPKLDEWWPPNGWNCRCQLIALTDPVEKSTKMPDGAAPDPGFAFNPGKDAGEPLEEATSETPVAAPSPERQ
jgi:SPP1 gp7 family putative phage head morphogenesis protein